ncbi:MAG TPA: hypothetical protein VFI22_13780 [Thermomicrobiales bacterium]|nr:hypothetical protein [Thermomicrobiales bacterium]
MAISFAEDVERCLPGKHASMVGRDVDVAAAIFVERPAADVANRSLHPHERAGHDGIDARWNRSRLDARDAGRHDLRLRRRRAKQPDGYGEGDHGGNAARIEPIHGVLLFDASNSNWASVTQARIGPP